MKGYTHRYNHTLASFFPMLMMQVSIDKEIKKGVFMQPLPHYSIQSFSPHWPSSAYAGMFYFVKKNGYVIPETKCKTIQQALLKIRLLESWDTESVNFQVRYNCWEEK